VFCTLQESAEETMKELGRFHNNEEVIVCKINEGKGLVYQILRTYTCGSETVCLHFNAGYFFMLSNMVSQFNDACATT
jgi:hypothetical protein